MIKISDKTKVILSLFLVCTFMMTCSIVAIQNDIRRHNDRAIEVANIWILGYLHGDEYNPRAYANIVCETTRWIVQTEIEHIRANRVQY